MLKIVLALLMMLSTFQLSARAQNDQSPFKEDDKDDDKKVTSLEETLTRAAIDREEEKNKKIVAAAEELNTLAKELLKTTQGQSVLTAANQKKLDRIEKLAKQVRADRGKGAEDVLENEPTTLTDALERLQKAAEDIENESCKLNRHSVNVTVIARVNEVLALTKTIKRLRAAK